VLDRLNWKRGWRIKAHFPYKRGKRKGTGGGEHTGAEKGNRQILGENARRRYSLKEAYLVTNLVRREWGASWGGEIVGKWQIPECAGKKGHRKNTGVTKEMGLELNFHSQKKEREKEKGGIACRVCWHRCTEKTGRKKGGRVCSTTYSNFREEKGENGVCGLIKNASKRKEKVICWQRNQGKDCVLCFFQKKERGCRKRDNWNRNQDWKREKRDHPVSRTLFVGGSKKKRSCYRSVLNSIWKEKRKRDGVVIRRGTK